jgi:DeoR/GlpR family transcriptional regulator of sugar metabolism
VALDVGTTTLQIPGHLDGKRSLTIVTPSSPIANVLIGQPDLRHETVGRLLDLGIEVILA